MSDKLPPQQGLEELALMMLYLTRFSDDKRWEPRRAWKTYDCDTLDKLDEKNLVDLGNRRNKSCYLTDDGLEKAKVLLEKYGIEDWDWSEASKHWIKITLPE